MRPLFTAHLCPSLEDGNTSSPCHHCTVPAAYSGCKPAPVVVVAHHTRSYSSYDLRMISRRGRTEVGFGVLVWTWEGIRAVYERWYGAWALSRHEPSQWLQCGDTLIGRKTYTKRSYEIIQMHWTRHRGGIQIRINIKLNIHQTFKVFKKSHKSLQPHVRTAGIEFGGPKGSPGAATVGPDEVCMMMTGWGSRERTERGVFGSASAASGERGFLAPQAKTLR